MLSSDEKRLWIRATKTAFQILTRQVGNNYLNIGPLPADYQLHATVNTLMNIPHISDDPKKPDIDSIDHDQVFSILAPIYKAGIAGVKDWDRPVKERTTIESKRSARIETGKLEFRKEVFILTFLIEGITTIPDNRDMLAEVFKMIPGEFYRPMIVYDEEMSTAKSILDNLGVHYNDSLDISTFTVLDLTFDVPEHGLNFTRARQDNEKSVQETKVTTSEKSVPPVRLLSSKELSSVSSDERILPNINVSNIYPKFFCMLRGDIMEAEVRNPIASDDQRATLVLPESLLFFKGN